MQDTAAPKSLGNGWAEFRHGAALMLIALGTLAGSASIFAMIYAALATR